MNHHLQSDARGDLRFCEFQPDVPPKAACSYPHSYTAAYLGILLFFLIYFGRPGDWIPGISTVPIAKIAAAFAVVGFVIGFLNVRKLFVPKELWLLIFLFLQLCIAIPFSHWRGGSFELVIFAFSKFLLITFILVQTVNSLARLRRLLFVHTIAVATVCVVSVFFTAITIGSGRLTGALGNIFDNPNDLASSITLVFPLGLAFLLGTRNIVKKAFWLSALGIMLFTLIRTYSRGGFLSMAVVLIACSALMGTKARRTIGVILAVVVVAIVCAGISGKYTGRVATIFDAEKDETGSSAARQTLLLRSLKLAIRHPLFGVGPGQFVELGGWHAAHNSYTELAAEAGILAAVYFIWMLVHTYRKVLRVHHESLDTELHLLSAAIAGSMAGFFITLLFSSVEYLFLPYFLVAYGSVIGAIATQQASRVPPSSANDRETNFLGQWTCAV